MSFLGKWFKSSKAYWPTPTRWATLASLPLMPIIILAHILLLSQLQYIAWPENFLWPYFNFSGLTFYKDIFYIYPPFYVILLSGWFKIVGLSLLNLQVISYAVIGLTDWLLYVAAKKKLWPLLIYIPLQIFFEGNGLWPDQLLAPIFLAGWLLFTSKKYFYLGIVLGLAMLTKQTAAYFALGLALISFKNWGRMLSGALCVLALFTVYFIFSNNFTNFWQQTVVYIFSHHIGNSLQTLWPNRQQIIAVGLIYIPAVFLGIKSKRRPEILLMLLASLGIFTRFEYFHLQPALPFAVILLSSGTISVPFLLIFLFLFGKFLIRSYHLPPRFYTPDLLVNAATINQFIPPGSKTLIINSWDHYYYLTGTLPIGNFFFSSTPWNWSYNNLQEKEVATLEKEQPKYVVYGDCFRIDNICHQPKIIGSYIKNRYEEVLKLPDGTGIFENNPVSLGQEVQPPNSQK